MYNPKTAMTVGAVVKYIQEQESLKSIDSLSQILEGLDLAKIKKVSGKYYVVIKLYSIEEHLTNVAIPFNWDHRHKPSIREGIMVAKAEYKLECMLKRDYV
jgi:hypothetical protein